LSGGPTPDFESGPPPGIGPSGLRISDLAGLIVGYSLSAVLIRSFWGVLEPESLPRALALLTSFVWLGLAMSGPVVLLLDRRAPPEPAPFPSTDPPSRYSLEEMAWMGIGGYFVALTLFVVPARNRETPWSMILLIQAVAAAILLVWLPFARKHRSKSEGRPPRWTRRAAVVMLLTWPLAWFALVLLFR
jgi:hypothetical protein